MSDQERYDNFVKRLEEEHPHMFSRPYGGVAVGEGWWTIVSLLCHAIDTHVSRVRRNRAQELRQYRASKKGIDAVLKTICKGAQPREWEIELAQRIMKRKSFDFTPYVHKVTVSQIKEKFGGLRFYYDGGDEYVVGLVDMAEMWANRTCETCGTLGKQRDGGWVRTLCDVHEAEYQERKKKS